MVVLSSFPRVLRSSVYDFAIRILFYAGTVTLTDLRRQHRAVGQAMLVFSLHRPSFKSPTVPAVRLSTKFYIHAYIHPPEYRIQQMAQAEEIYQKGLALKAVLELPREDVLYPIFNHFSNAHQNPPHRFITYPQMTLQWNPTSQNDQRSEVPDFGLINFTLPGNEPIFKLHCGVEVKCAIAIMEEFPKPESILSDYDVITAFHTLDFQAKDQAKAAYKNNYPLANDGIDWILLVGPYWRPSKYGPFSTAESSARALKPSESGDFEESMKLRDDMHRPPPNLTELYLLGTPESYERLEEIIASTDLLAQPYIDVSTLSIIFYCSNYSKNSSLKSYRVETECMRARA